MFQIILTIMYFLPVESVKFTDRLWWCGYYEYDDYNFFSNDSDNTSEDGDVTENNSDADSYDNGNSDNTSEDNYSTGKTKHICKNDSLTMRISTFLYYILNGEMPPRDPEDELKTKSEELDGFKPVEGDGVEPHEVKISVEQQLRNLIKCLYGDQTEDVNENGNEPAVGIVKKLKDVIAKVENTQNEVKDLDSRKKNETIIENEIKIKYNTLETKYDKQKKYFDDQIRKSDEKIQAMEQKIHEQHTEFYNVIEGVREKLEMEQQIKEYLKDYDDFKEGYKKQYEYLETKYKQLAEELKNLKAAQRNSEADPITQPDTAQTNQSKKKNSKKNGARNYAAFF